MVENIFESFKIIYKGIVFWVRAKEVSSWIPDFVEDEEEDNDSDGGIIVDRLDAENDDKQDYEDVVEESDVEEVSETIFEMEPSQDHKMNDRNVTQSGIRSEDPFNIYDLLNKNKTTLIEKKEKDKEESICSGHFKKPKVPRTGGSMLQVMEDLVKVGQIMGYNMKGCLKNIEEIIELSEKKMLWDYLTVVIGSWNGEVVIMGDFNEVRTQAERYGSIFNVQGANAFNSFISAVGLEEVHLGGCSFTWCHISANKMSKLDRFLISEGLMSSCPNISATTLDRYLSDHRPILMREAQFDYGPIPFRFYHYWFELEGFDNFVERTWNEVNMLDSNDISNNHKMILKAELAEIDLLLDRGGGDSKVLNKRLFITKSLQDIEKIASMEVAQKAKMKWAIEGDENSKYYHGILNKKRSQLTILGILVDGTWIDSPILVKNFPNKLNIEQQSDLECDVSRDEIKRAVWDRGPHKSPGPDGFTFGFYRRYWSFFGEICVVGSLYKIIAKILANCLVVVLGDIVNEVQSTFVANRQILDVPFILNELFHWCKKKKKQTLIFKVDFEKAYDSVQWGYLDDFLKNFGFGDRWRGLIQSCLNSSKGSVIVNGSPTSEVVDAGMFRGISMGTSLQISHLFYANDAVFMGQWSDSNIKIIVQMLDCFYRASRLRINMNKSKLMGISVATTIMDQAANNIGCTTLKALLSYLGSKVDDLMYEILNNLTARLSKWKMKTLSIGTG
ncbi:RNA-directed DNA polymerase, eukaryota, reverse transcriptase zinc-binding domain protein [Tanacetum coccineum]